MNAIDLLEKQHETTRDALEQLERAPTIDPMELRMLADELVAHMVIEEHVFYPRVREVARDVVTESFEEHAVARFELARVLMAKGDEQRVRVRLLKELIEQHLRAEETELLPKVRRALTGTELEKLGPRMESMFERAVELGFEKLVVSDERGPELRTGVDEAGPRARAAPPRLRSTQRRRGRPIARAHAR